MSRKFDFDDEPYVPPKREPKELPRGGSVIWEERFEDDGAKWSETITGRFPVRAVPQNLTFVEWAEYEQKLRAEWKRQNEALPPRVGSIKVADYVDLEMRLFENMQPGLITQVSSAPECVHNFTSQVGEYTVADTSFKTFVCTKCGREEQFTYVTISGNLP